MYLPQLNELDRDREMIEVFKGYNHNLRISEGEFYDMKNLSSNNYPVISPRPLRGVYKKDVSAHGIIAKDGIGYIDGSEFRYNNKSTIGLSLSTKIDVKQTIMVSMGAYVIIITKDNDGNILDKKWVDTNKTYETKEGIFMVYGDIESYFEMKQGLVYMCNLEGNTLSIKYSGYSSDMDETAEDGDLWLDNASTRETVLKTFVAETGTWEQIKCYIKIESTDIGTHFKVGESVNIEQDYFIRTSALEGNKTILKKADNYIIYEGILDFRENIEVDAEKNASMGDQTIIFSRKMPLIDFLIESGNRLWGCRYGLNDKGEMVNEIYASKLGDFKNWYSYQGISTDSYAVSVGSDGGFTGAITYKGQPIFFKENCMHRVYGTMPSNYQMQTTECRGVMKGASKSLAIVNELLYYKSRGAVCMYDGSYPTEVSQAFGEKIYGDAVGGALGSKYYISLKSLDRSTDINSVYELFVFDTSKGLWHKEDETEIRECASYMGNLYYIDGKQPNKIKTFLKGSNEGEKEVRWMAKTGIIGLSNPDRRYISKINIRASTTVGSWFSVFIKYNSMGDWIYVGRVMGATLESFNLQIIPRRCDHFQLKFEGVGEVKIYSICKTIEKGGDY